MTTSPAPKEHGLTDAAVVAINAYLLKITLGVSVLVGGLSFFLGFTLAQKADAIGARAEAVAAKEIADRVVDVDRALERTLAAEDAAKAAAGEVEAAVGEVNRSVELVNTALQATSVAQEASQQKVQESLAKVEAARKEAEEARDSLKAQFDKVAAELLEVPGFKDDLVAAVVGVIPADLTGRVNANEKQLEELFASFPQGSPGLPALFSALNDVVLLSCLSVHISQARELLDHLEVEIGLDQAGAQRRYLHSQAQSMKEYLGVIRKQVPGAHPILDDSIESAERGLVMTIERLEGVTSGSTVPLGASTSTDE